MNNIIMLEQNLIDLSIAATPGDMLLELSNIIENNGIKDRKIKLILGNLSLTPAHVCGLKSVLESAGVEIEVIYTNSVHTQLAALGAGLAVSESAPDYEDNDDFFNEIDSKEIEIVDHYTTEKALEEAIDQELLDKTTDEKIQDKRTKTLYLKQTLRSGQLVSFDGNIIIIGDCHSGSEIIASGDITVWGVLSGIAHAGAQGDYNSSIRALKINAIQLRIADLYARKPDRLEVEKIEKTNTFTPEEARISDGEIIIYALNG